MWDFVQAELAAHGTGRRSTSRQRTFSGKIRCAQCGAWYGSKTWHAGSKYEKRIWRCNHKYAGTTPCSTPHVSDEQITAAFLDAVYIVLASRNQVDDVIDRAVAAELDTTDLHIEADQLFARVGAAAEAIDALIACNARVAQDQGEYQRRFDKLNTDHALLLDEYHQLLVQISDLENRQAAYCYYKEQLATLDLASIEFKVYLGQLVARLAAQFARQGIHIALDDVVLGIETAIPCALIVNELVSNSVKHAFPDGRAGRVRVGLQVGADDRVVLSVSDDGVGLPPGFVPAQSLSLGWRLVLGLTNQIGGSLEISARGAAEGGGTQVAIGFRPAAPESQRYVGALSGGEQAQAG